MSIFIRDASGVPRDIESREQIKSICALNDIACSETAVKPYKVEINNAEIIIAHLGNVGGGIIENVSDALHKLQSINSKALIIAESSGDTSLNESRRLGFPSFKYPDLIRILEEGVKLVTTNKSLRQSIEEIISGKASVSRILSLFLPLDIDLQAIARVRNKTGWMTEIINPGDSLS